MTEKAEKNPIEFTARRIGLDPARPARDDTPVDLVFQQDEASVPLLFASGAVVALNVIPVIAERLQHQHAAGLLEVTGKFAVLPLDWPSPVSGFWALLAAFPAGLVLALSLVSIRTPKWGWLSMSLAITLGSGVIGWQMLDAFNERSWPTFVVCALFGLAAGIAGYAAAQWRRSGRQGNGNRGTAVFWAMSLTTLISWMAVATS